jgi:hypothetical protein
MLSATFIDLFYIPLFFVLVSRLFKVQPGRKGAAQQEVAVRS